jgi:hypothetical protein
MDTMTIIRLYAEPWVPLLTAIVGFVAGYLAHATWGRKRKPPPCDL